MEAHKFSLVTLPSDQPQTKAFLSLLTQCNFNLHDERKATSDLEVAQQIQLCHHRFSNEIAIMQASIVFRAVKAGDKYMSMYKNSNGSDERCSIRPKLKIDTKYQTLEMSWVRRVDRIKPTSSSTQPVATAHFRRHKVETAHGSLMASHHYEYIKKGLGDRYSNLIFRGQPLWAQKLGADLEDKFSLLRKEQKKLSALRKSLKGLKIHQEKWFTDQVKKQLDEWLSNEQSEILSFGDEPNLWLKGEIKIITQE